MSLSKVFVAEKVIASSTPPEKAVPSPGKKQNEKESRRKAITSKSGATIQSGGISTHLYSASAQPSR
jgi:hypothetical protein